jgi:hypothetical protein
MRHLYLALMVGACDPSPTATTAPPSLVRTGSITTTCTGGNAWATVGELPDGAAFTVYRCGDDVDGQSCAPIAWRTLPALGELQAWCPDVRPDAWVQADWVAR